MTPKITCLIFIASVLNAFSQLLFKAGLRSLEASRYTWGTLIPQLFSNFYILNGLACLTISTLIWLLTLAQVEVGLAAPISTGIINVIIAIAAWHLFDESLSLIRLLGIGIIISGICLISYTEF